MKYLKEHKEFNESDWQERYDRLMADMEQEAEPEGGPIADDYARQLEELEMEKRRNDPRPRKKELTYGEAMARAGKRGPNR